VDLAGEVRGLLNMLPTSDWVLGRYTGESASWSTVTPVVMPGHDDGDAVEGERLLRRAFAHAGLSDDLMRTAELQWRAVGFVRAWIWRSIIGSRSRRGSCRRCMYACTLHIR
jgi:CRISPR-associated protein Csb2